MTVANAFAPFGVVVAHQPLAVPALLKILVTSSGATLTTTG